MSQEMLAYLVAHRGSAEYLVAVNCLMAAAPIILETWLPVVAMGGVSGERSAWVQANCALVDPSACGAVGAGSQLYDCAPAPAVGGG